MLWAFVKVFRQLGWIGREWTNVDKHLSTPSDPDSVILSQTTLVDGPNTLTMLGIGISRSFFPIFLALIIHSHSRF